MPKRSINPADFGNEIKNAWRNPWRALILPITLPWQAIRPGLLNVLDSGKDAVIGGIRNTTRIEIKGILNIPAFSLPGGKR
jgi:hypothetical protein